MEEEFVEWLRKWLNDQDWSQNRLADAAGISTSQMSRIMNGMRVSPENAERLSRPLNLPADTILQMAGRIKRRSESNARFEELLHLFGQLSDEDQDEEIATLRLRIERRKRGSHGRAATTGKKT